MSKVPQMVLLRMFVCVDAEVGGQICIGNGVSGLRQAIMLSTMGRTLAGGGLETYGYCRFREVPVFVCVNVCRDGNQFQVALVLWQC